MIATI